MPIKKNKRKTQDANHLMLTFGNDIRVTELSSAQQETCLSYYVCTFLYFSNTVLPASARVFSITDVFPAQNHRLLIFT